MTEDGTWSDESDWELTDSDSEESGEAGPAPVVAIVGRPNVGKSTLVNRIIGRREAVVQDVPGVTRDRVSYDALWTGRRFVVQDTGGWEPDAKGLQQLVAEQASVAMRTADAVILVVDATVGATTADEAAARILLRSGKPVFLAANKVDNERVEADAAELWSLGLGSRTRSVPCTVAESPICSTRCWARCPRLRNRRQVPAVRGGWRWSANPTSVRVRC